MKVSLWAEIRRLKEIEQLSRRAIAKRLHCDRRTINKAMVLTQPHPAASPRDVAAYWILTALGSTR